MDYIDQRAFIWKVTGLEQMRNKKIYDLVGETSTASSRV